MSTIWLNRYIIETTAPMAISSGRRETGFDTQLARDANELPYIPATAITGVWRHLTRNALGETIENQWFGSLEQDMHSSLAPKLHIQHGLLLDSKGEVVLGLLSAEKINKDDLLRRLQDVRPHYRDHVRINDRGVAEEHGKYDKILLPKGVRFCIDVRWQGDEAHEAQWLELQNLLAHPLFALGASTRNGLGRFKVVASHSEKLKLAKNPKAGALLTAFMRRSSLPVKNQLVQTAAQPFATLQLQALDTWRCGKGSRPLYADKASEHTDSFTYSEPYIGWQGTNGLWHDSPQAVLCGSSIKGMLAHRLAYHYRRLSGQFAEDMEQASHTSWEQRPDDLRQLLGDASQEENRAQAGRLIVEDVVVDSVTPTIRTHTSIDRFTGGVRQGALYSEELLWQPEFTLKLHLVPGTQLSEPLKQALEATLTDLKSGLLPLGAGSGRGSSLVMHKQGGSWDIQWQQIQPQEAQA
ncbi:RAMP superfamily CRISPR-associated protein [Pseudomonas sp. F1_0610]|uniref:RAMP superfamily CRISPR-associated protein n=1 Tax=Pseudomonas sp. F1_0610 TaxID=3114284 RepID=UPI0039C0CE21